MLTQAEIDYLLAVLKELNEKQPFTFPDQYDDRQYSLISVDRRDKFTVIANRKGHKISTTCTFLESHQSAGILLRLDISGSPHTNPDGRYLQCPHIHIMKEGYGDAWAYPVPAEILIDPNNLLSTFIKFLEYCKVVGANLIIFQDRLGF